MKPLQQLVRSEAGCDLGHGIDEGRLIGDAKRGGEQESRTGFEAEAAHVQHADGAADSLFRASPGTGLVAAECDENHFCLSGIDRLSKTPVIQDQEI